MGQRQHADREHVLAATVAHPLRRPRLGSALVAQQGRASAIAAVVLLAVLAGAGWFYRSRMGGGETIDSVAVLPFVNGSGDPNVEYLSDGITESLINSLSQLPHLKVMSRDSAFHVQGQGHGCANGRASAGRSRGLQGPRDTARRQPGNQRGTRSTPATTATSGASSTAARRQDIFALQGDLAKEITTALRTRLTGEDEKRMTKSYTANPEAYQDYLKGRYWWNKTTRGGIQQGHRILPAGNRKRPQLTLWLMPGLADCYSSLAGFGYPSAERGLSKSQGGRAQGTGNGRHARRSSRLTSVGQGNL